ncbi:MAG: hypothetical protein AB1898_11960 [Acidobacteriota bacterium]
MLGKLLRRAWLQIQIAFDDNFTIEGFEKTGRKFNLPEDLRDLDAGTKRKVTICNLFANQQQSMWDIARVLDIRIAEVVTTLIENELVKERRRKAKSRRHERREIHRASSDVGQSQIVSGTELSQDPPSPGGSGDTKSLTAAAGASSVQPKPQSRGGITTLGLNNKTMSAKTS